MPPERHDLRTRGNYRELIGPVPGFVILVGRSIAPELDELRNYLLKQIAAGVFMLGFGLSIGLINCKPGD